MAIISVRDVSLNISGPQLLDAVCMQVEEGERVCLMGRNGAGKSTFLQLISGERRADSGQIVRMQGARIASLPQNVPDHISGSVYTVVCSGVKSDAADALAAYYNAQRDLMRDGDDGAVARMADAQLILDKTGGWDQHAEIMAVLNHLRVGADVDFDALSGGMKRRCLLARALISSPDLLLLDEPTNHLDMDSIEWLEEFLLRRAISLIFITHDRAFLRRVATRIIELDRGHLADWRCGYEQFLERKQAQLDNEEKEWANFDKKLAQEEVWIRQGIKARRTRNMGRVRELEAMRRERQKRRERQGNAVMQVQEAERSGKLVIETEHVSYIWKDATPDTPPVVKDLSTLISRGDKVGIIGANGVGKTTLLRLLLGELQPNCGTVRHGTRLEIGYFDQLRNVLDGEKSVRDAVANGDEYLDINGQRKHVLGYLKEFLFEPQRCMIPVKLLSGGERNRLLLAKLFARPTNLLVMDEPSNDLDMETLELLEELLADYKGTVLVVSHDRAFLNNVVTSTIVMEGKGIIEEFVGGYDDWLRQRTVPAAEDKAEKPKSAKPSASPSGVGASSIASSSLLSSSDASAAPKARKLSYGEQREKDALEKELAELPATLEALEKEQADAESALADPTLYSRDAAAFTALSERLTALESEQETALLRWEEIEARLQELGGEK